MAVDAPLLTRQRVFAAKIETTTGTAISLGDSDGAIANFFDAKMEADIPPNERQGQGSLSALPQVPGARKGKATFRTELVGSGSGGAPTPSWANALLVCAGMSITSEVATFVTGSASAATLTLGLYQDGRKKIISGAMLDVTMKCKSGNPVQLEWKAEGVWNAPAAAAMITPTYPTIIPPRFAGATFTIGGTSYRIDEMDIQFGNVLYCRQDAADASASGYHACVITNRKPTIKVDPEALALGTKDWFADHLAGTTFAVSAAIGSDAGNTITIAAPAAQLLHPPKDKDRNGILVDDLEFTLTRNSSAGDDELSITFS